MLLATTTDMEVFIFEKSPHVKSVEVNDDNDDRTMFVKIKLPFWYRLFYGSTFHEFITAQVEENKLYGITVDIKIVS